jgi:ABC-type transport system substrate-binding protein
MRAHLALFGAALLSLAAPSLAQQPGPGSNPQIDFPGFVRIAAEVQQSRESRLVDLATFQAMAGRDNALLLDARSAEAFAEGHIDGAVNLPLPDFTAESLAATIGQNRDRPILIYCNNNFSNDVSPVVRKAITLALNIQTMINLVGYGYPNVYELGEVVDFTEPQVGWVTGD